MASRSRTRLTLNEVLSGVFDDDFGLSGCESSEEEGEDVLAVERWQQHSAKLSVSETTEE